jgi:hypothetical protein
MHTLFIIDPHQRNRHGDFLCWREWITDPALAAEDIRKHLAAGRWVCPYDREEHEPYCRDSESVTARW